MKDEAPCELERGRDGDRSGTVKQADCEARMQDQDWQFPRRSARFTDGSMLVWIICAVLASLLILVCSSIHTGITSKHKSAFPIHSSLEIDTN